MYIVRADHLEIVHSMRDRTVLRQVLIIRQSVLGTSFSRKEVHVDEIDNADDSLGHST